MQKNLIALTHEAPAVLTTAECAAALRIAPKTLLRLVYQGRCPIEPRKVGRKLVWPTQQVRAALGLGV